MQWITNNFDIFRTEPRWAVAGRKKVSTWKSLFFTVVVFALSTVLTFDQLSHLWLPSDQLPVTHIKKLPDEVNMTAQILAVTLHTYKNLSQKSTVTSNFSVQKDFYSEYYDPEEGTFISSIQRIDCPDQFKAQISKLKTRSEAIDPYFSMVCIQTEENAQFTEVGKAMRLSISKSYFTVVHIVIWGKYAQVMDYVKKQKQAPQFWHVHQINKNKMNIYEGFVNGVEVIVKDSVLMDVQPLRYVGLVPYAYQRYAWAIPINIKDRYNIRGLYLLQGFTSTTFTRYDLPTIIGAFTSEISLWVSIFSIVLYTINEYNINLALVRQTFEQHPHLRDTKISFFFMLKYGLTLVLVSSQKVEKWLLKKQWMIPQIILIRINENVERLRSIQNILTRLALYKQYPQLRQEARTQKRKIGLIVRQQKRGSFKPQTLEQSNVALYPIKIPNRFKLKPLQNPKLSTLCFNNPSENLSDNISQNETKSTAAAIQQKTTKEYRRLFSPPNLELKKWYWRLVRMFDTNGCKIQFHCRPDFKTSHFSLTLVVLSFFLLSYLIISIGIIDTKNRTDFLTRIESVEFNKMVYIDIMQNRTITPTINVQRNYSISVVYLNEKSQVVEDLTPKLQTNCPFYGQIHNYCLNTSLSTNTLGELVILKISFTYSGSVPDWDDTAELNVIYGDRVQNEQLIDQLAIYNGMDFTALLKFHIDTSSQATQEILEFSYSYSFLPTKISNCRIIRLVLDNVVSREFLRSRTIFDIIEDIFCTNFLIVIFMSDFVARPYNLRKAQNAVKKEYSRLYFKMLEQSRKLGENQSIIQQQNAKSVSESGQCLDLAKLQRIIPGVLNRPYYFLPNYLDLNSLPII